MSRVHFRGGPWSNAEDQALKVGLAKYGPRDWERVASIVPRKTAAQCRERWENYLDPRLNLKEAWSPEEEEKLVELQSLFPNQWRLISDQLTRMTAAKYIRPPWLCEQHYLEMRDAHEFERRQQQQQTKEGGDKTDEGDNEDGDEEQKRNAVPQTLEEFMRERRQRRTAYQAHEEKAARADIVDGDHTQEEMLTMAVSRLANQDQKKGLRKERERKLAETSFLAKLESNRESIESGTLSTRQAKRMRKALEEDRRGVAGSSDDDEVRHKQPRHEGDDSSGDEEDDDGEEAFQPMDVLEDQERAGVQKKSRTLLVNLDKQQGRITASSAEASSAAAGVNTNLLDQLTAGPSFASGVSAITGDAAKKRITSRSGGSATTWDALAGPSTAAPDLDDLFAGLPGIVTTAAITKRTTTAAVTKPAASVVESDKKQKVGAVPEEKRESASAWSVPPPLPPSRATPHSSAASHSFFPAAVATVKKEKPLLFPLGEIEEEEKEVKATVKDVWACIDAATLFQPTRSRGLDSDEETLLAKARALVEVETECAFMASRRQHHKEGRNGSARLAAETDATTTTESMVKGEASSSAQQRRQAHTDESEDEEEDEDDQDTITAEDIAAVKAKLDALLRSFSSSSSSGVESGPAAVPAAALVAAVAAAQDGAQNHTHLNTSLSTRELESAVHKDVGQVNAALSAIGATVVRVAVTSFLDPCDPLLTPFVDKAKGQLRHHPLNNSTSSSAEGTAGSGQQLVLAFVKQHWEGRLQRSRQQAVFLSKLREREQYEMVRRFDAVQFELQTMLEREGHLQELYRQRATK